MAGFDLGQAEQMNGKAKCRHFFATVLGVLIWATTVALLEVRLFVLLFWKLDTGMRRNIWRRFFWGFLALPITATRCLVYCFVRLRESDAC